MLPLDTAARSPSTMITTIDDDFRLQLLEPEARERTENLIMARDGLIEALLQAFKNADDPDWTVTNSVTALRDRRREHNNDANQLEKLGMRPGGSVDIFYCRTSIEDTVHMLADGDVPVAPFDQLARVVTYQRETADEDRQPTNVIIYDNGRLRKVKGNFSTRRTHFDGGLKKLIGILLDAWMIGADVRVLATMPVRISGNRQVVKLVMGLASKTVFVEALGKPVGELLDNEEARDSANIEATSNLNELLEALRKKELNEDQLEYSNKMHAIYRKRFAKEEKSERTKEKRKWSGRLL